MYLVQAFDLSRRVGSIFRMSHESVQLLMQNRIVVSLHLCRWGLDGDLCRRRNERRQSSLQLPRLLFMPCLRLLETCLQLVLQIPHSLVMLRSRISSTLRMRVVLPNQSLDLLKSD